MDRRDGEGTDVKCPDLAVVELSRVHDLAAARQGRDGENETSQLIIFEDRMHK